jgi:hypothetical protein
MQKQMTEQEAIETLELFRDDYTREDSAICQAIDIAIDALKQTTIEPEVRHGRWIWFESEGTFIHLRKCSECGDIKAQAETNFCPNCGARMDLIETDVY